MLEESLAAQLIRDEIDQKAHEEVLHTVTDAAKEAEYQLLHAKRKRDEYAAALPPEGSQLSKDLATVARKKAKLDKSINEFLASNQYSNVTSVLTEDDKSEVAATFEADIKADTEREIGVLQVQSVLPISPY